MEEDEVDAGLFELVEAFRDLLGGANKTGAEAAVGNGIVFEGDTLLELGSCQPLLVVGIASCGLLNVRDASDFILGFRFGFADDGVTGDAEFQRDGIVLRAALTKVGYFFRDPFGRIAVHEIGVTFCGDEIFCGGRFAARVNSGARF